MAQLIGIPGLQFPNNAQLDFAPVTNALAQYRQASDRAEQWPLQRNALMIENDLGRARLAGMPLEQELRRTQIDQMRQAIAASRLQQELRAGIMRQIGGLMSGSGSDPVPASPAPPVGFVSPSPAAAPPPAPAPEEGRFFTIPPLRPAVSESEPSRYGSLTGGSIPEGRTTSISGGGRGTTGAEPGPPPPSRIPLPPAPTPTLAVPSSASAPSPATATAPTPAVPAAPMVLGMPLDRARRLALMLDAAGMRNEFLEKEIATAGASASEAERARGQATGRALGEAQAALPQAMQSADTMIGSIDAVINDPNIGNITGWQQQPPFGWLPYSPGGQDTLERVNQIQGQAFLQAFQSLRGGGQITEQEGAKAQAALTRLGNLQQSDVGYRQALFDARREVWDLMNLARTRAGQPPIPYQPHTSEPRRGGGSPSGDGFSIRRID